LHATDWASRLQTNLRCGPDDPREAPGGGHRGPARQACPGHERAPTLAGTPQNYAKSLVETELKEPDRLPPMPVGSHGCLE